MNRNAFVDGVLHGADRSAGAFVLRGLLTPLAGLHRIGLEAYLLPYNTRIRKRFRLSVPVISIGNLSSGGTGKTPMAALVAGLLSSGGRRTALLSRGHGGGAEAGRVPQVVSDGAGNVLLSPETAGDEPMLLARTLPEVPVIIGRDRRRSGRLAVERFNPYVIVLDDALQYWQLHRDLDIVLLDARRPFDNGWMLPRGLLREPPAHLARAGIIVLTRADRVDSEAIARTRERLRRLAPKAEVFLAVHEPLGWVRADNSGAQAQMPVDALAGRAVFAFSGIADGAAFTASVKALGARVTEDRAFPDHFHYDRAIVNELAAAAAGTEFAVTTEKDLVKAASLWPRGAPPLLALRIGMRLDDLEHFSSQVISAAENAAAGKENSLRR